MEKGLFVLICLLVAFISGHFCASISNDIVEYNTALSDQPLSSRSWMDTAQDAISGPAGQMVVHFAKELISRSTGSSQILSLNLTNLLVLILLKALIFAAGIIGAGHWSHYGRSRNYEPSFLHVGEAPLMIGFLAAQGSGKDGCLYKAACESPEIAAEYIKAASAIVKGAIMFDPDFTRDVARYEEILANMDKAVSDGKKRAYCKMIYHCDI